MSKTKGKRISKDPEKVFNKYEKTIREAVRWFVWKYGGNFDELLSWTGDMFMAAFLSFDPQKGSFETWLKWVVTKGLLNHRALMIKYYKLCSTNEINPDDHVLPRQFPLMEFLDSLSEDSRYVVRLALYTPQQLIINAIKRGGKPATLRAVIREYLGYLGWSNRRINNSFQEIRTALGQI